MRTTDVARSSKLRGTNFKRSWQLLRVMRHALHQCQTNASNTPIPPSPRAPHPSPPPTRSLLVSMDRSLRNTRHRPGVPLPFRRVKQQGMLMTPREELPTASQRRLSTSRPARISNGGKPSATSLHPSSPRWPPTILPKREDGEKMTAASGSAVGSRACDATSRRSDISPRPSPRTSDRTDRCAHTPAPLPPAAPTGPKHARALQDDRCFAHRADTHLAIAYMMPPSSKGAVRDAYDKISRSRERQDIAGLPLDESSTGWRHRLPLALRTRDAEVSGLETSSRTTSRERSSAMPSEPIGPPEARGHRPLRDAGHMRAGSSTKLSCRVPVS